MTAHKLLPYPDPAALLPPADTRRQAGKHLRQQVPRSEHAAWRVLAEHRDPIALLRRTDRARLPSLIPIRYGRMLASPAAYFRGAAAIMAQDLSQLPVTGSRVQVCGDAHLGNFGGFATPERALIFDLNDFDETVVGPWEWDVKRLVASAVITGREQNLSEDRCQAVAHAAVSSYREQMHIYGAKRFLEIWYSAIQADELLDRLSSPELSEELTTKARAKTNVGSLTKLADRDGHRVRISNDPPLVTHRTYPVPQRLPDVWSAYRASLPADRRTLVNRYRVVDIARKVVGVGSVGLRCFVILLLGTNDEDPLFLQLKEARPSVLEPYGHRSAYAHAGKRVVTGQRIMQAASDLFLGWTRCGGVDYYVRQLRDMKLTVPVEALRAGDLAEYARLCGWALARAHACSGDPALISGYLGAGATFDRAIVTFAVSYADQTERDYGELVKAVKAGRVPAETGI